MRAKTGHRTRTTCMTKREHQKTRSSTRWRRRRDTFTHSQNLPRSCLPCRTSAQWDNKSSTTTTSPQQRGGLGSQVMVQAELFHNTRSVSRSGQLHSWYHVPRDPPRSRHGAAHQPGPADRSQLQGIQPPGAMERQQMHATPNCIGLGRGGNGTEAWTLSGNHQHVRPKCPTSGMPSDSHRDSDERRERTPGVLRHEQAMMHANSWGTS